jgi:hypothetical protein
LLGGLSTDPPDLVITERLPGQKRPNLSVFSIERNNDVGFFAVLTLGGGLQRRFDRGKYDLLINIFLAMKRIDVSKDVLWIHAGALSVTRRGKGENVPLQKRPEAANPGTSADQ